MDINSNEIGQLRTLCADAPVAMLNLLGDRNRIAMQIGSAEERIRQDTKALEKAEKEMRLSEIQRWSASVRYNTAEVEYGHEKLKTLNDDILKFVPFKVSFKDDTQKNKFLDILDDAVLFYSTDRHFEAIQAVEGVRGI